MWGGGVRGGVGGRNNFNINGCLEELCTSVREGSLFIVQLWPTRLTARKHLGVV